MLIFWPFNAATVLPFFSTMPSLPLEKSPTIMSEVSTPPAAGIVRASMLVSVTPSNLPAVYWLMDST